MCVCDPNSQGHNAISFISNVLSQCIYEPIEIVGFVFGWLSIILWFCAHFPQVRVTFILKTSQGLSLPFICLWIFADGMNLVSGIITKQLFTSLVLYAYCTCMDVLFLIQFLIFFKRTKRMMKAMNLPVKEKKKKNKGKNKKNKDDVENQNDSMREKKYSFKPLDAKNSLSSDHSSSSSSSSSLPLSQKSSIDSEQLATNESSKYSSTTSKNNKNSGSSNRKSSIVKEIRKQRGSVFSGSVMGGTALKDLLKERRTTMILAQKKAQAKANKVIYGGESSNENYNKEKEITVSKRDLTKMSVKTIIQIVFYVIMLFLILAFAALWVDAKNSVDPVPCVETTTSKGVFIFGYVVAWLCSIAYIIASPISIIHILKSKSADDKSPVFFGSCAIGNTFYLLSMFLSPLGNKIWIRRLPYIISTCVSTTFYYIDMAFIAYYQHKSNKTRKIDIEMSYGSNPNISQGGSIMEEVNTGGEDVPQLTEDTVSTSNRTSA